MGDFKPRSSGGRFGGRPSGNSGGRGGFGGERRGGSGFGGRPRDSKFGRGGERKSFDMHDAICSDCQKVCQVPFKPTGSKPVFCSDCFRKQEASSGGFSSNSNFNSRPSSRPERSFSRPPQTVQSGVSAEQFSQLNKKLDKILSVLQDLELDVEADSEELEGNDIDEDSEEEPDSKSE